MLEAGLDYVYHIPQRSRAWSVLRQKFGGQAAFRMVRVQVKGRRAGGIKDGHELSKGWYPEISHKQQRQMFSSATSIAWALNGTKLQFIWGS